MTSREMEIVANMIARLQQAQIEGGFGECIMDLAVDTSYILQEGSGVPLRTDNAVGRLIVTR